VAGETAPGLDTWIQVPFQLGELASRANYATLVARCLALRSCGATQPGCRDIGARPADVYNRGAAALRFGPLAGSSARALKRFVNLYRLARVQNQPHKGALAFLLALDAGGTRSEIAAVNDALSRANPEADLDLEHCGARLVEALAAAQAAQGKINVNAARHAAATARLFSFHDGGLSGCLWRHECKPEPTDGARGSWCACPETVDRIF